MDVELTRREGSWRCVVCHDEGAPTAAVEACDACGATYHPECRASVDGCATLGCQRRTAPPPESESSPTPRARPLRALGAAVNGAAALGLAFGAHVLVERLRPGEAVTREAWAALAGATSFALFASALALWSAGRRRRWRVAAAALLGWLLLAGIALPGLWHHARPITSDEVAEVAIDLERGMAEVDVRRLARRFNLLLTLRRHLPGAPPDGVEDELRAQPGRTEELVEQLARSYGDGGSFRVIMTSPLEDPPTIVARAAGPAGHLDYLTFELVRDEDGVVRVVDCESLRLGSSWGDELPRVLRTPSIGRALRTLAQLETPEEVLAAFDRLGFAERRSPTLIARYLDAAEELGDPDAHEAALVRALRATRGRSHLLEVELAFVREDPEAGLRAVNDLSGQGVVMSDPFLDAVRAELALMRGDAPRALELARDAASAVPDVERVWWVLLDCALELADHAWTRVALERLVLTFRVDPTLIAESFDLAEFEASPESAAWRDARDRAPSGN